MENFLLAIQSLFERGLRRMMATAAYQRGEDVAAIRKAYWDPKRKDGIHQLFARLFGAPLAWFGPHEDLDRLQTPGNCLRHGDGASAERLHDMAPSLWHHWLPPGTVTSGRGYQAAANAPRHRVSTTSPYPCPCSSK